MAEIKFDEHNVSVLDANDDDVLCDGTVGRETARTMGRRTGRTSAGGDPMLVLYGRCTRSRAPVKSLPSLPPTEPQQTSPTAKALPFGLRRKKLRQYNDRPSYLYLD